MTIVCTAMKHRTVRDIEQFLYREARLLDDCNFKEWLNLLTDDVRYWMPSMSRRYSAASKAVTILHPDTYEDREYSNEREVSILDETKDSIARRIARLDTGMAWAEDPPSRTCRIISNVSVRDGESDGEMIVDSNFILYRTRGASEQDFYVGSRHDVLRSRGDDWKISYRKILIPQNVLSAKNASNFF